MRIQVVKIISIVACLIGVVWSNMTMSQSHQSVIQDDSVKRFIALASDYEHEFFDHYPELGIFWGRKDIAHDKFMDHSLVATQKWQKREDEFLLALNQLNERALQESPQYITYRLLKETLENNKKTRICQDALWNVSPTLGGWLMITTKVAEKQPVGTPEYRTLALKRWNTFATIVDDEINNLKEGLRRGYSAPKSSVHAVLKQLKIILEQQVENSPYFDFAARDGSQEFKDQVIQLIETIINPSLKRYANYLEKDYLPLARAKIGVAALPNGKTCYQAKIKKETTLSISPKEVYEYGLEYMEELKKEVAAIGLQEFGIEDMTQVFQQATTRSEYLFQSEQDILNYNLAAYEKAKSKMSAWFGMLPKAEGIIKPYPEYRAKTGASGEYNPPSEDGSEPGIFYINTYEPTQRSRVDQEATLFHELIPGHHLQIALSYENKSHQSLDKYLWNSGYGEGWALYVERLADEMELYTDTISRLGMLANESLRTARLVVDPGIHVMNWSREKAIAYLKEHTTLSDNLIEGEVDRYIMLPGQATAYMLGKREIERLRQLAVKRLNDTFDIKEFHDQILKHGAISLPMLQEFIYNWLDGLSNPKKS